MSMQPIYENVIPEEMFDAMSITANALEYDDGDEDPDFFSKGFVEVSQVYPDSVYEFPKHHVRLYLPFLFNPFSASLPNL